MLISFVHKGKAFLPEIGFYRDFFEKHHIHTSINFPEDLEKTRADVEWWFMGSQFRKADRASVIIHEYASASLPPFRKLKDQIKKRINLKPDFRLFLNEYTRKELGFRDAVPHGLRDMGIDFGEVIGLQQNPIYDFIYCGSVSKDMCFDKLLDCFKKPGLKNKSILVLSKNYQGLQQRYQSCPNIIFKGPVPQKEVATYICSARFAINYKPAIAPHRFQTATKMLEYAACRVPIITSDFFWVRQFQEKYGGQYFYLKPDFSNFEWEAINQFQYTFPDLKPWSWENQIRGSGVLEFLQSKFPEIQF